ncbi:uncharacterized protein UV8b_00340 [Ustilaginoidea virens]|uniref:Cellobiose dehydrogenase-like cytochrome domain-containing protein n=1 Tax=Ustilaginoidea virens TaxID=1159556 RepID=A0A8E5HIK0_USTVR|nr:uncharacterized protein UV8b_00340 [Ustilaginoidea virens]QUC16099.1 hypothetical protein UV8b_00340 [Ustilaginoidea virens]
MLPRFLWRAAAALAVTGPAAVGADDANPPGQSTFISPDNHVAFAFTVPQTPDHQYPEATFFSIRVPNRYSWGAVGLGSNDMKGALYLIIYQGEDGASVTFSPRLAYDNTEPTYWDEMEYTVIPNNTGVVDDHMIFTAMCTSHCRSWNKGNTNGGWLDVSSPNQNGIFAVGPAEPLRSNDRNAPLKFHGEYGVFTIDMGRTQGAADAPVLDRDSQNESTALVWYRRRRSDYKATLHGTFMIFFIVGMMNFGVFLLRACGWAKWHAVNQLFATLGVLSGLALGVLTSFHYNRSRGFKHYHQIIGYIVVAFVLAQVALGVKHHLEYQKTRAPTRFGRIHLWLGRLILLLAVLNSFFGFSFARNQRYAVALAGLLVLVCAVALFFMYNRTRFFDRKRQFQPLGTQQPPPWRQQAGTSGYGAGDAPPGYESASQHVGLQPAAPSSSSSPGNSPWRSGGDKDYEDEPQLGSAQKPREFT